jgi:hypothetical protein
MPAAINGQPAYFGKEHNRCLHQGEKIIMERRIFMIPIRREASGNPVLYITGENLVRSPPVMTGKSKPNPQNIQQQAEEEDAKNPSFPRSSLRGFQHGYFAAFINIVVPQGLSICDVFGDSNRHDGCRKVSFKAISIGNR